MAGGFDDVALGAVAGSPRLRPYEHVHPLAARAPGSPRPMLVLPHADSRSTGTVSFGERELELDGARGGQAHLWGSKPRRPLGVGALQRPRGPDARRRPARSSTPSRCTSPRLGREIGPSTPVVGRLLGEDFAATSPVARRPRAAAASG